jgi:hypothetical protein
MQKTAGAILKTASVALAASTTGAFAKLGVITREAYACISWAGAYAYTLASLTEQGATQMFTGCFHFPLSCGRELF